MHRHHLPACIEAVNTANRACHVLQEHARPVLESLIGKVVRKKDGRPGKVAVAALIPAIRLAYDVGAISVYFPEARRHAGNRVFFRARMAVMKTPAQETAP